MKKLFFWLCKTWVKEMNLCESVESVGVFFMSHGFHRFTQIFYALG